VWRGKHEIDQKDETNGEREREKREDFIQETEKDQGCVL
jgi:hypothetical protein